MNNKTDTIFWASCLVLGQTLNTLSSFYWESTGRYSMTGSVLIILAMVFWAVGFVGLFGLLKKESPWFSRFGLLYAFYGCLGGIAFGFEGLYSTIFDLSDQVGLEAFEKYPLHMNLVLFWAGPAFPLTLLLFGVMWIFHRKSARWIGLAMAFGGILFPISRILRIELVAHLADLVLLVPVTAILLTFIKERDFHPDPEKSR